MPLEAPVTNALRPRRFKSIWALLLGKLRDRALEPFGDIGCEGRAHEDPQPRRRVDPLQYDRYSRQRRLSTLARSERARPQVEARGLRQHRPGFRALELQHDSALRDVDHGMVQARERGVELVREPGVV